MPVENDQQMACGVREAIQSEKSMFLAKKDETSSIFTCGGKKAKNAVRFLAVRGEVVEAPGSP